jgi:hypothetical protein
MANWCSNYLTFQGDAVKINEVKKCFDEMIARQKEVQEGVAPAFFKDMKCLDRYFFDLYTPDDDAPLDQTAFNVQYETKWSPNIEDVTAIVKHFEVDCEYDYSETGNGIYGKFTYESATGTENDVCLDDDDFGKFNYLEASDIYTFEGNEYESDGEILETLLERKLNN